MTKYENIIELLKRNKIKLTHQRLAILDYLLKNRVHPDAIRVYEAITAENPSIAKSTVYNTIKAFERAGILKAVNFLDGEAHFDIDTSVHGHFKCSSCGEIFDFEVEEKDFERALAGYTIEDLSVYARGVCPRCRRK
ncbi:MAG TPA: Fur family transcriptional regulator [Eubacteriales bacterium]|jgi:Fur family peroxide stress response transcriptional regulator|nr:Fur family transcriptional regulator [Clostridia bacterium]HRR89291.1 Fur family transcriptional regulator [Eubacteriales bacterium]HRU83934.1 Fur family transcriptional regulator [Eubacteriales bacterium]